METQNGVEKMANKTIVQCAHEARQIIQMANRPFVPADLAQSIAALDADVAAMIPAMCALLCCDLKDGTGRVALA
jgi:hypothetical protein